MGQIMNYFSNNLRYLRKLNGLTQDELAIVLGKSRKTISAWELGTRSPIVNDLVLVSNHFKVDIVDLFDKDLAVAGIAPDSSESDLLSLYRSLNAEQKSAILTMMKSMVIQ